jgi:competence protein ComEA
MTFKYRYRKQIIIISIIVILIGGVTGLSIWKYSKSNKKEEKEIVTTKKNSLEKKKVEQIEKYKVDIKGEVINPGIYSLEKDKRVIDVIALAGGLTENADTSVINLSKKINDEMVIIVYSHEQVTDFKKTKEIEKQVQEKCIQPDENSLRNDSCITTENSTQTGLININTASIEELTTLPGIGESKAKDIIKYRETNNGFKSIDELTNISGIGESILVKIKENITV